MSFKTSKHLRVESLQQSHVSEHLKLRIVRKFQLDIKLVSLLSS